MGISIYAAFFDFDASKNDEVIFWDENICVQQVFKALADSTGPADEEHSVSTSEDSEGGEGSHPRQRLEVERERRKLLHSQESAAAAAEAARRLMSP
jgi:hypothetical protein